MKSKIDWIRRGQRVIRMVSELHRMGYQRLRLMPYFHPNAWRLAVAPKELFSDRNGAFIAHDRLGNERVAIYSAAGGGEGYFDWTDARSDDARALAEKFITRLPAIAECGKGRDWEYAGWVSELVGFLELGDWLPAVYWEYMKGSPDDLRAIPIWVATADNLVWSGLEPSTDPRNPTFDLPPKVYRLPSE
jgi:hypothetical protein